MFCKKKKKHKRNGKKKPYRIHMCNVNRVIHHVEISFQ